MVGGNAEPQRRADAKGNQMQEDALDLSEPKERGNKIADWRLQIAD